MNKTLYILFSLCSLVLSPAFCAEKNLLTDGGFECKGDGSVQKYSSNILRHWLVRFNGIHNGEGFLAGKEHAFRGNSALRLVSKGRKQMTSADAKALIEVSPGETVTGRIRYKGYGGAHLHFYFLDQNKKRLKKIFRGWSSGTGKVAVIFHKVQSSGRGALHSFFRVGDPESRYSL